MRNFMIEKSTEVETLIYVDNDTEQLELVSIPSDIYSSRAHQQGGRRKHGHTCIEMAYVISGNATHILFFPDGHTEKSRITIGNYIILDHTTSHLISDVSKDFFAINVLFSPTFMYSGFDQHEPFDNVLRKAFTDLHLHTVTDSVANRVYNDEERTLKGIFEDCWDTYKKREPGYRNMLRCYISVILIKSVRTLIPKQKSKTHNVIDIRDYINDNYMHDITLTGICKEKFLNPSYTSRKFKEVIGISFETYLQNVRIQNACALLSETSDTIDRIIEKVGYTDGASFRKHFKRMLGVTPIQFRKMHK